VISVGDAPRELRAVAAALRVVEPDLRREINTRTRTEIGPVWRNEIDQHARTPLDRAVLTPGIRVAGGNPPTAYAANSRRKLKGGLIPAEDWAPAEFGTKNRNRVATYTRRTPGGKTTRVTRHTARGPHHLRDD
jgi:hypothetical protein